MKIRKMIELLEKCDPQAKVKAHHRKGENISFLIPTENLVLETYQTEEESSLTVQALLNGLYLLEEDMDVILDAPDGNPLLFVVSYENIPGIVVLEDAGDNDLSSELEARFEYAAEEQLDELDFFMDLLDTGFTLDDIKENLPEQYEYSKSYMEEHGLI